MDALLPFATRLAAAIFARHPEWETHATEAAGELVLRLPAPAPGRPGLTVATDGGDDSVEYGGWHGHPARHAPSEGEGFDAVLACVEGIVAERLVAVTDSAGGAALGWSLVRPGAVAERALPPLPPGAVRTTRSWAGTFDTTTRAT